MVKTENENLRLQLKNESMCNKVSVEEGRREVIAERSDPEPPQQLWTKSRMERERKRKAKERNSVGRGRYNK